MVYDTTSLLIDDNPAFRGGGSGICIKTKHAVTMHASIHILIITGLHDPALSWLMPNNSGLQ